MVTFEFINNEEGYSKRDKKSVILNLSLSFFLFLIITITNNWKWGAIIALIFFLVQFYKSKRWDKVFINKISFDIDFITINYTEQNTQINLAGNVEDFIFKKELAFNRTKASYLAIYYSGMLKLKQFEIGDWTEIKMDNLIESFNEKINK